MTHIISEVRADRGRNDVVVPITIIGTGFTGTGLSAQLENVRLGITIALTSVVFVSTTRITASVPVNAIPNIYTLRVTDDGTDSTLNFAFRVLYPAPIPPFAAETFDVIRNRMRANARSIQTSALIDWDLREGSFMGDAIDYAALGVFDTYSRLTTQIDSIYLQETSGTFLDLKGQEFGLSRKTSLRAAGTVTFSGTAPVTIPKGTIVATTVLTESGVAAQTFQTLIEVDLVGSTIDATVEAITPGAAGNVEIAAVTVMVTAVAGLSAVTNAAVFSGGSNLESDLVYRERILREAQQPVAGGNSADYITWALEANEVKDGKVTGGFVTTAVSQPLWNGGGTVRVLFLVDGPDADGVPNATQVQEIQDYIDPTPGTVGGGRAPVGSDVTVIAPTKVSTNITVTITIRSGFVASQVQAQAKTNIEVFLVALPIGEDILLTELTRIVCGA